MSPIKISTGTEPLYELGWEGRGGGTPHHAKFCGGGSLWRIAILRSQNKKTKQTTFVFLETCRHYNMRAGTVLLNWLGVLYVQLIGVAKPSPKSLD